MCSRPSRSLNSTVTALMCFSSVRYFSRSSRMVSAGTRRLRWSLAAKLRSSSSEYDISMKLRSASDMLLLRESCSRQNLAAPKSDDDAARGNERPAYVNGRGGRLVKPDLGQHLGHQEKQHHIDPQQFPKIPTGNVDRESVQCENHPARDEKKPAGRTCRAVEPTLKQGITESFQQRGQRQQSDGSKWRSHTLLRHAATSPARCVRLLHSREAQSSYPPQRE